MDMNKLNITLRRVVNAIHKDYYTAKIISKNEFEARRDRVNRLLAKTYPHRDNMKKILSNKKRREATSRYLRARQIDILHGRRVLIVMNLGDDQVSLINLKNDDSFDMPVEDFNQNHFKDALLVSSSFVNSNVRIDRGIDLCGMCAVLGISVEGGVVNALANHMDIPFTDYQTTIKAVTSKIINDFDQL